MKISIQAISILLLLFFTSVSSFATDVNSSVYYEENIPIRTSAELISHKTCQDAKGNITGFSATVRVNVYATFGSTETLVASQTVSIPCGTVGMTRRDFDVNASNKRTEGIVLVTEYLDKNDKEGEIFGSIKENIYHTVQTIESKK